MELVGAWGVAGFALLMMSAAITVMLPHQIRDHLRLMLSVVASYGSLRIVAQYLDYMSPYTASIVLGFMAICIFSLIAGHLLCTLQYKSWGGWDRVKFVCIAATSIASAIVFIAALFGSFYATLNFEYQWEALSVWPVFALPAFALWIGWTIAEWIFAGFTNGRGSRP